MLNKLILYLVRKKLGLKKFELFKFTNQKTTAEYYFTETAIMRSEKGETRLSTVSLNWLLDEECSIEHLPL